MTYNNYWLLSFWWKAHSLGFLPLQVTREHEKRFAYLVINCFLCQVGIGEDCWLWHTDLEDFWATTFSTLILIIIPLNQVTNWKKILGKSFVKKKEKIGLCSLATIDLKSSSEESYLAKTWDQLPRYWIFIVAQNCPNPYAATIW